DKRPTVGKPVRRTVARRLAVAQQPDAGENRNDDEAGDGGAQQPVTARVAVGAVVRPARLGSSRTHDDSLILDRFARAGHPRPGIFCPTVSPTSAIGPRWSTPTNSSFRRATLPSRTIPMRPGAAPR